MPPFARLRRWVLILLWLALSACVSAPAAAPIKPTVPAVPSPSVTALPPAATATTAPSPTAQRIRPSATPLPTSSAIYLDALVWKDELVAPVILYHRFLPVGEENKPSPTKMHLDEFQSHLEALYEAGFSLIPIEKWLAGDISLPPGRRPLIFSMDDLFFADQIFLEADGTPSKRSGLGVLWHFSQQHPDFGFSAALFYNLGDKYYANLKTPAWFLVADGWQDALASVIVWCIEHDAMPYNHTYLHSDLSQLDALAITDELRRNDRELRNFLKRAGREDLIPRLENYIALPFGIWPASEGLKRFMFNYKDPENKPVNAVFEAGYFYEERFFPAPFVEGHDPLRIPRITTNTRRSIEFLSTHRSLFPQTETCRLGPLDPSQANDPAVITRLIQAALFSGACHEGYYRVNDYFFEVKNGEKKLIWTVQKKPK